MAGYTITIMSNDETAAQTTIRVDTASGSARITELTVRAAEGGGIFPRQLPALNLDQLIAALVPSAPTALASSDDSEPASASVGSLPAESLPAEPATSESAAVEQVSAPESVLVPEASDEPVETPQLSASASARGARSSRAKKAARTAPAKKAPARSRQTKAEKTAATQSPNGRRAYRRMPEANELLSAYREVGGTTALARHYGVPRHTATGWLRRLRMQGLLES